MNDGTCLGGRKRELWTHIWFFLDWWGVPSCLCSWLWASGILDVHVVQAQALGEALFSCFCFTNEFFLRLCYIERKWVLMISGAFRLQWGDILWKDQFQMKFACLPLFLRFPWGAAKSFLPSGNSINHWDSGTPEEEKLEMFYSSFSFVKHATTLASAKEICRLGKTLKWFYLQVKDVQACSKKVANRTHAR